MSKRWTKQRRNQIRQLNDLLQECRIIDDATGTIERLKRITRLAKSLMKIDLSKRSSSFVSFLDDVAHEEE